MKYLESINNTLDSLLQQDETILILGEDICDPYGGAFKVTKGLSSKYPDRVINMPISEAGFTGLGIGLALSGFKPIVEIMFGDFLTLTMDQVLNGASKLHDMYSEPESVPLIIRTPMGGRRGYGATHSQSIESMFFKVPFLEIVAPSHLHNPGLLLEKQVRKGCFTLFIENKSLYSQSLYPCHDSRFFDLTHFGDVVKANLKGSRRPAMSIIAYGGMVPECLNACIELFESYEIYVNIIAVATIKPLPINDILDASRTDDKLLIVDESFIDYGWAAEVITKILESNSSISDFRRIGSSSGAIPCAENLENDFLLNSKQIVNYVLEELDYAGSH